MRQGVDGSCSNSFSHEAADVPAFSIIACNRASRWAGSLLRSQSLGTVTTGIRMVRTDLAANMCLVLYAHGALPRIKSVAVHHQPPDRLGRVVDLNDDARGAVADRVAAFHGLHKEHLSIGEVELVVDED